MTASRTAIAMFTVLAANLLAVLPCHAQSDDLQAQLDRAIKQLRAWRQSFATLHVQYRWVNTKQLTDRLPELRDNPERLAGWYHLDDWWWTDRPMVRSEQRRFEDGKLIKLEVSGRNDRYTFGAMYDGEAEFPRELSASGAGPQLSWNYSPVPLLLYGVCASPDRWLDEIIAGNKIVPYGIREIHGARCVGYVYADHPHTVNWLDLEHDGILRMQETLPNPEIRQSVWTCLEFVQTPSGQWFPKRIEYYDVDSADEIYSYETVLVEMNSPLPSQLFQVPRYNNQTVLVDMTRVLPKSAKVRSTASENSTRDENASGVADPGVKAVRPHSLLRWWILAGAAVVLLSGLVFRVRA